MLLRPPDSRVVSNVDIGYDTRKASGTSLQHASTRDWSGIMDRSSFRDMKKKNPPICFIDSREPRLYIFICRHSNFPSDSIAGLGEDFRSLGRDAGISGHGRAAPGRFSQKLRMESQCPSVACVAHYFSYCSPFVRFSKSSDIELVSNLKRYSVLLMSVISH